MRIIIKRIAEEFHLRAVNEQGQIFDMDASPEIGGTNKGMRPMEVLLSSLGGCSSIDVLLILRKQKQEVTAFEVELDGDKENIDNYSLYRNICLHFKISGNVDEQKVHKAIQLSLEKYCSVAKTLEPTAKITYKLTIYEREKI